MVRTVSPAAASLAAIRACKRLGMAMAAIIRMMATTMRSSIREKPRCVARAALCFAEISWLLMSVSLSSLLALACAELVKKAGRKLGLLPA